MVTIKRFGEAVTLPSGAPNPLTQVVRAGDLVFVSGLMPRDASGRIVRGSIGRQTSLVMRRLEASLAQAQCTFADLVKVTVWLTKASDFAGFNRAYADALAGVPLPARSAVRCDLLLPGARLEIEAVAVRSTRRRRRGTR